METKRLGWFAAWAASWAVLLAPVAWAASPLVVAQDGSGDFTSAQAAIDAVPSFADERTIIYIKNGVYREKITVATGKLISLIGEDPEKTILTYDDYAQKIGPGGTEIGTSGSYSFRVLADDFYAENLTFENAAGWGNGVGQAVALLVQADRAVFYNVRILGHQDTLYANGEGRRQYYKDCYIEGTVDFIFGSATAVFDSCHIHSVGNGYVTAASTPANATYGYVFLNSRLTGAGTGQVYLGRPWRPYASVTYVNTWMDRHIRPEGWHNWNDPSREQTARYAEYGSTGPGAAARRVPWAYVGSAGEGEGITVEAVLGGSDGWDPRKVIASHFPYRGQPDRPAVSVQIHRPAANGRTRVAGLLEVDVDVEVADPSLLKEVSVAIDGRTVYAGRDLEALRALAVETATLSDGLHRFSVAVRYGEFPPLESSTSFIVANHWDLTQELQPPEDAGWFGVVDYLRTKERSSGWTYETGDPELFFGDSTRLRRAGAAAEFLTWETPGLERAVIELYAPSLADVETGLELALYLGGRWLLVPFTAEVVEEAGEWRRVRVALSVPDPHSVEAFRLALRDTISPERLQLGRVVFRGVAASGS